MFPITPIKWAVDFAGWVGSSPTMRKILAFGFVLLIGFAWGNYHATERALKQKESEAAAEEAKTTGDLFTAYKGKLTDLKVHLAEDRARDQGADTHAAVSLAKATTAAQSDHDVAIVQIAKDVNQEKAKEIINVSAACPPVESFHFSPDTRRVLDQAAGAIFSSGPTNGGAPASGSVRRIAPAAAARLTATGR